MVCRIIKIRHLRLLRKQMPDHFCMRSAIRADVRRVREHDRG